MLDILFPIEIPIIVLNFIIINISHMIANNISTPSCQHTETRCECGQLIAKVRGAGARTEVQALQTHRRDPIHLNRRLEHRHSMIRPLKGGIVAGKRPELRRTQVFSLQTRDH